MSKFRKPGGGIQDEYLEGLTSDVVGNFNPPFKLRWQQFCLHLTTIAPLPHITISYRRILGPNQQCSEFNNLFQPANKQQVSVRKCSVFNHIYWGFKWRCVLIASISRLFDVCSVFSFNYSSMEWRRFSRRILTNTEQGQQRNEELKILVDDFGQHLFRVRFIREYKQFSL